MLCRKCLSLLFILCRPVMRGASAINIDEISNVEEAGTGGYGL